MVESNNTGIDQLNLLRSILRTDDHLHIQPSGDYEQVQIRLDHDIQISFFFDSLVLLTQPLTINTIHDLRINKSSNKCPLTNEQWTNLRKYFDELTQQSDKNTSLRSIIQLVQDHLLQTRIVNPKYKPKEKKTSVSASIEDISTMNKRFRGGDLIFNRILHDRTIDRSEVVIGYEDRFTGIHEIPFNEFKKVHDDRYGVPMHRIQHFKINGRIVWDRKNRIDILTGSEQQQNEPLIIETKQNLIFEQGLYHFDQSLEQWILLPHVSLSEDHPKNPSTNDTCLPKECHFLTWNILFDYHQSELIHTSQRYPGILHTLKSLLPDVICLQEVTATFLNLLLKQQWLQEHHYYVIITQSVITNDKDKSYGQLILTKNVRPRSFSICPLDVCDDFTLEVTTVTKKPTKELLIARFGLTTRTCIDLVNLHLHSDLSRNAEVKRCRALENIFKQMNTSNYMLIGDFNFGDYHEKEQKLLEKYSNDVHDLWKEMYDLNENPGFTFDPSRNLCAGITSASQINRRLDRYFIHTLQNLSYSVEHLNMVGIDTIPINRTNNEDDDGDKRISLSDHYALQLIIQFRTRSISHRSALVILPTTDHWSLIKSHCEDQYSSFTRWPPHFNLLWPFFDLNDSQDDEENILLPLRLLLSQHSSFTADVNEIDTFVENNVCFMKLSQQSTETVKQLYAQLKQLFPQCCINDRNNYSPHMTLEQFENAEERIRFQGSLTLKKPFQFPVNYVYILQRPHDNDTTPFHITYQLPLGPVLPPLGSIRSNSVNLKLQELFHSMNLYESEQSYTRKQDTFQKLSLCIEEMFNKETLYCFTHAFIPYGSFRIGVNGADIDTVFVLNEVKSNENESTTFDETLQQLKHDPNALNNYIMNLLETQINRNLKDEIIFYRKIQALFPIISILFKNQTKVEIFVQIRVTKERSEEPIHGVDEIEHLLIHSRSPVIFQYLLSFIRSWAQYVGLYGQVYGYLSGYSWAILCAQICHSHLSPIVSLASIEHFSIDDFFSLVYTFFSTYAHFPWSTQSVHLHLKSFKQITHSQKSSVLNRGSMRIISPTSPFSNSARSTINSTRDLTIKGFQCVVDLLDQTNTITSEDKITALKQILELKNDFPNSKIKSLVQLTLTCESEQELDEWIGWMKSRLVYFINDCENECRLTLQTQNTIDRSPQTTEAYYFIGFQLDQQILKQQRKFTNCLTKFLDQFNLYPQRKDTMTVSYEFMSVHDWQLERIQPKTQRTRK